MYTPWTISRIFLDFHNTYMFSIRSSLSQKYHAVTTKIKKRNPTGADLEPIWQLEFEIPQGGGLHLAAYFSGCCWLPHLHKLNGSLERAVWQSSDSAKRSSQWSRTFGSILKSGYGLGTAANSSNRGFQEEKNTGWQGLVFLLCVLCCLCTCFVGEISWAIVCG